MRIRKDAIARRIQRGSAMPPGLTDTLTRGELRDLIKYLASLGQNCRKSELSARAVAYIRSTAPAPMS